MPITFPKWPHNITNIPKNLQTMSIPRSSKIYPNCYFWSENICHLATLCTDTFAPCDCLLDKTHFWNWKKMSAQTKLFSLPTLKTASGYLSFPSLSTRRSEQWNTPFNFTCYLLLCITHVGTIRNLCSACMCIHVHKWSYMCMHVLTCAYMCIHVYTCECMWIHMHTCAYMCIHMTCTLTLMLITFG
jgi:hypothetical protein